MVANSSNDLSAHQHTSVTLKTSAHLKPPPIRLSNKFISATMRVLLPAAILVLVNMVPISIAAPVAVPAPTAQPSSSLPALDDRSVPLEARVPTKTNSKAAKGKAGLGRPTDYAHVDLQGMLSDLRLPQYDQTNDSTSSKSNSNSTTATSAKSSATATSTTTSLLA